VECPVFGFPLEEKGIQAGFAGLFKFFEIVNRKKLRSIMRRVVYRKA